MRIVERQTLSPHHRDLLHRIHARCAIDVPRGYVLFDDNEEAVFVNPRSAKSYACYMNIASGGLEGRSPDYVLELMERDDCDHFIWVSRGVGTAPTARFTWVYAHEYRHLVQRVTDELCARANNLLHAACGRTDTTPKTQLEFPAEFDAELFARDTVRDLLGAEALSTYLAEERVTESGQRYFDRFAEIESGWSGDLRAETLAVVCPRRAELRGLQSELQDSEYEFDLDAFCRA